MRLALISILILAAGAAGWFLGDRYAFRPAKTGEATSPTTQSNSTAPANVRGIGKLEPDSGVIKVVAPFGKKVESLFGLKIGEPIALNQPIVKLGGRDQAEMELKLAKARKTDARQQLEFEKSQGQLKKESAMIALSEARANGDKIASKSKDVELLVLQYNAAIESRQRLENLRSNPATRKLVGKADLDKHQLMVQQLEAKIEQAKQEIKLATEQVARAEEAAEIDIATIDFVLEESSLPQRSMNTAINAASKAVELMEIKSPVDGIVLDIVVRPGDTVMNQPVMLVGDTRKMICVAEINDVNLRHVHIDDRAKITSVALSDPLHGTVVSKGIMIGPPSMKDPNPFASVDRKTGRVVIELDDGEIAGKYVNLQVDVEIIATSTPTAE